MRPVRAAVLVVASFAGVAGGCKRGVLGDPGTGNLGGGMPDAGNVPGDIDAGTVADASPASDLVVGAADGSAGDGIIIGPPVNWQCPNPPLGPCPIDRPTAGDACAATGTLCEYGGADLSCRDRWHCAADLTWQLMGECAPELAGRCPVAMPETGSACAAQVFCAYPGRTICFCTGTQWACPSAGSDPRCPDLLPLRGSACVPNGTCSYGSSCLGLAVYCCNGAWSSHTPTLCPE